MGKFNIAALVAMVDESALVKGTAAKADPVAKAAAMAEFFKTQKPGLIGEIPPKTEHARVLGRIRALQTGVVVTSKDAGTTKGLTVFSQRRYTDAEKAENAAALAACKTDAEREALEKAQSTVLRPYNPSRNSLDYLKIVGMLCEDGVPVSVLREYLAHSPEGVMPFFDRIPKDLRAGLADATMALGPELYNAGNKTKGIPSEPNPLEVDESWLREFWTGESQAKSAAPAKAAAASKPSKAKAS